MLTMLVVVGDWDCVAFGLEIVRPPPLRTTCTTPDDNVRHSITDDTVLTTNVRHLMTNVRHLTTTYDTVLPTNVRHSITDRHSINDKRTTPDDKRTTPDNNVRHSITDKRTTQYYQQTYDT